MQLATTTAPGRGDTDLLLHQLAQALQMQGLRCCGTVQINTEFECNGPCDMDVQCLPDGPVIRISQSLGRQSRGCRLNPEALEQAVAWVEARLGAGEVDLLIVNKFGKHEADGRGFREAIGLAMAADVPVLVGLNAMNLPAFEAFTGQAATHVAPDLDALVAWAVDATGKPATAA